MTDTASPYPQHKPRPMVDMLVSILIPSVILMKFSSEEHLGVSLALVVALAFPLGWGLFELARYRKFNFIALLGVISVCRTGGIGLLKLDPECLAVKEAAVPRVIGLAVLIATRTRYPLIRTLLYNKEVLNVDLIHERLAERGLLDIFELRLLKATYFLAGTFFFSSVMNFILAKWIVVSPAGTQAFNEELGRMTLVSYPMIAIPSMIMMMLILFYLWRTIHGLTGLKMEEIVAVQAAEKQP